MRKHAPSFQDHISRYTYALWNCYNKDVLDAGSKEGFGAQILSWVAKTITLSDISQLWLRQAEKIKGYWCPVSFVQSDFNKDFPKGEWDVVTAFEVLEHLEKPDFFLENVVKSLRKDGLFIFSVPHMDARPDHITLFDETKIKELISKYLDIQELFVQDRKYLTDQPLYKNLICYVGVAKKKDEDKVQRP